MFPYLPGCLVISANKSCRVDAETQTTQVVFPQERNSERTMEQIIDTAVPQDVKGPELDFMAPALAGTRRRRLAKRATLAAVAACACTSCRVRGRVYRFE